MNAENFIEILKAVNTMEEIRFWAVWATVSITSIGWVVSKVIAARSGASK